MSSGDLPAATGASGTAERSGRSRSEAAAFCAAPGSSETKPMKNIIDDAVVQKAAFKQHRAGPGSRFSSANEGKLQSGVRGF